MRSRSHRKPRRRQSPAARSALAICGGSILLLAPVVAYDELAHSSAFQAHYFTRIAREASYQIGAGASASIRFPAHGPFDERLGYVQLPAFLKRLQSEGCTVVEQARWSERLTAIADWGLSPPYREPSQAGLRIADRNAAPLLERRYPGRVFARFEDIPKVIVDTLLFIEDRELLRDERPQRNPALELDRLARAALDRAIHWFDKDHHSPGGSTLATQIEKYRHSRDGRTESVSEKLRQMVSASLRAYRDGADTRERRRDIILEYLNTVPLGGRTPWGEVHGLGDGLWTYFGRELHEVTHALADRQNIESMHDKAQAYAAVLALLLAQRRPSELLSGENTRLPALMAHYLELLARAGVIGEGLRDAAMVIPLRLRQSPLADPQPASAARKAADAVRNHLGDWLGVARRYDLDRLDVTVATTLDARAQREISAALRALGDPAAAQQAGLLAERLLAQGDPAQVVYSVTLYERRDQSFRLLVQADNLEQPFDVNEGLMLDLGSTAKLRTLSTYLELVAELHARFGALDSQALRDMPVSPEDTLARWALAYLAQTHDRALPAMLDAALERRYSADTAEAFFTGGGLHRFQNFRREDDGKVLSVREAFRESVNLVFIRLLRDVIRHYAFRDGAGAVLRDRNDPRRASYLARFADYEGREFLRRYVSEYRLLDPSARIAKLIERRPPTPAQLAAVFLSLGPTNPEEAYRTFLASRRQPAPELPPVQRLPFERYVARQFPLVDRAYLAGVHPLELWLVSYLNQHPAASFAEIVAASADVRQETYRWLFKGGKVHAQERAIRIVLEMDAFAELHRAWKRTGYPFDALVPSLATAVGASADRPASLALLIGTVLADGVRLPVMRVAGLRFAAGTPYETALDCRPKGAEQVFAPEVAQALRKVLVEVIDSGTAVRAKGLFGGATVPAVTLGGKTGTGDHRHKRFSADGTLRDSRAVSRAGAFVFFAGEHLFGVVTAYVPGPASDRYTFTSALPVQVFRHLEPSLRRLVPLHAEASLDP